MHLNDGSPAAAVAAPESGESVHRRCEHLAQQLDALEHGIWCVRTALSGPDPEASLVYLAALGERIRQVLSHPNQ